jgi:hypothetical protein
MGESEGKRYSPSIALLKPVPKSGNKGEEEECPTNPID